jgi:hypothetical protein
MRFVSPVFVRLGHVALVACCLDAVTFAQPAEVPEQVAGQPMHVTVPPHAGTQSIFSASIALPTWNGSFVYNSRTYTYNMVGTAPSTNSSTTVPVVIIPIKIVISAKHGSTTTYDPATVVFNGRSVVANTVASPLFDSTTTYIQGAVNVGKTQYIDAFQRANFWGTVQNENSYHLLLGGPTVLPEQTLSPPSNYGKLGSVFGFTAGLVDINWFDAQINNLITKLGISANTLPIFLTYDVYLTQGGCCIGGYHSATGQQSYAHATYVDKAGAFSQDVSALSHELGEWADDPLVVNANGNNTPCGILEDGDPLENDPNFGSWPYTVNSFTFHLQDLATLPYFGAPTSTTVNGWLSFHGNTLTTVCQNGS